MDIGRGFNVSAALKKAAVTREASSCVDSPDQPERTMKKLALLLLAAASLAGCVAVPYDSGYRGHPRGNHYYGDRDHDGISNRADRDRDGDGVPNRRDRRPDNPRLY